jgi:dephospho-CoA kinase
VVTLGVTGGLGAGKSTACQRFKENGAVIFDADSVAKEILQTTQEVQDRIAEEFGTDVVKDGRVDTRKLASQAFSNEENQSILNNIVHPYVIEAFEKRRDELEKKVGLLVVDAPLIFESGFDSHLDHTLLIFASLKMRIARALRRGNLTREEILRRMDLQMPEEDKRDLASFVIENNGSIEELNQEIDKLYQQLVG